jgi:ribosomal protein L30E
MADIDKILKAEKEGKAIFGFKETLKAVKFGEAKEVFITKTFPDRMKRQLKESADLSKIKLIELNLTSEELSAQLKKPFSIAVLAIK